MARASLHRFYVMMAKISPPEFVYVIADPIHYTEKVGIPSGISGCAMHCMNYVLRQT